MSTTFLGWDVPTWARALEWSGSELSITDLTDQSKWPAFMALHIAIKNQSSPQTDVTAYSADPKPVRWCGIDDYVKRGDTIVANIEFWRRIPIVGEWVISRLADSLDKISDRIEAETAHGR